MGTEKFFRSKRCQKLVAICLHKDTSAKVSVPEGWDTPQLQSFEGILAKSETISAYF